MNTEPTSHRTASGLSRAPSPSVPPLGFEYQMTVTLVWSDMQGCPFGAPDICWDLDWNRYPREVKEACDRVGNALFFECIATESQVFPLGRGEEGEDELCRRLKTAVENRNRKHKEAASSSGADSKGTLESRIFVHRRVKDYYYRKDHLTNRPVLNLWAGDDEYHGVWAVPPEPVSTGPAGTHVGDTTAFSSGQGSASIPQPAWEASPEHQAKTVKVVADWARWPHKVSGDPAPPSHPETYSVKAWKDRVATTAGFAIRAMGLKGYRPHMLQSREEYQAAGVQWPPPTMSVEPTTTNSEATSEQ